MHTLEQETGAAVATSRQLQHQRGNLLETLEVLRAMEGIAQVCVEPAEAGRKGAAVKRIRRPAGLVATRSCSGSSVCSPSICESAASEASLAAWHASPSAPCRPRARCRGCCRSLEEWQWITQAPLMCWRCCRGCWMMRACWRWSASSALEGVCVGGEGGGLRREGSGHVSSLATAAAVEAAQGVPGHSCSALPYQISTVPLATHTRLPPPAGTCQTRLWRRHRRWTT